MRISFVGAVPLSLATFTAFAWDDLNYFPVPVDIPSLSESVARKSAAAPMDTNRLRFEGMSDDERVYRRYRDTDMDEKSFLNDVKYDIDARLRTSMSTRGAKLYDGLVKTGAVLWGGYSFLEEGKSLTFSLETSDSSKAKFSFNREEEGSIVFTHRISPKYQQLLKFEVTSENDADGVFLRYTRTLN